jgi:hypothetical protein
MAMARSHWIRKIWVKKNMTLTLKTNRIDIETKVNSIDTANSYDKYNSKSLTDNDPDREIFNSPKLKKQKTDGNLEDDVDKI